MIPCVLSLVLVHTTCMNVRIRQSVVGSICRRRSLIWLDPLSFPLSPGDSSRLLPTNTSRKRTIHLHLLAWHFIPPTCRWVQLTLHRMPTRTADGAVHDSFLITNFWNVLRVWDRPKRWAPTSKGCRLNGRLYPRWYVHHVPSLVHRNRFHLVLIWGYCPTWTKHSFPSLGNPSHLSHLVPLKEVEGRGNE